MHRRSRHQGWRPGPALAVKVALSGGSGLIGTALCQALHERGDDVLRLVRRPAGPGELRWDPPSGTLDGRDLEGLDAAVHLSGAGIGDRRWTAARRRVLVASRVESTGLLARTLAGLDSPPRVLVHASAVGIYGDRGDVELTEGDPPGTGFLADLCRAWERASGPADEAGVRVVRVRTGIVLSAHGGALGRQLPLFRLGLGGRLGSGRQWTSWIALADQVRALLYLLDHDTIAGVVNATAPAPVTNRAFTAALGRAVHRPAVAAVPAVALKAVLGAGLVTEALLASQRVLPARLLASGFTFRHPDIHGALAAALAA